MSVLEDHWEPIFQTALEVSRCWVRNTRRRLTIFQGVATLVGDYSWYRDVCSGDSGGTLASDE